MFAVLVRVSEISAAVDACYKVWETVIKFYEHVVETGELMRKYVLGIAR